MTHNVRQVSHGKYLRGASAQASVEYILVICMLILASYGAVRLFAAAWKAHYNHNSATRAGIAGSHP